MNEHIHKRDIEYVTVFWKLWMGLHNEQNVHNWRIMVQFPTAARDILLLQSMLVGCGAHPFCYLVSTGGCIPES